MCTTELGAFAKLEPEFTKRNVKLIGLSANTIDSHSVRNTRFKIRREGSSEKEALGMD